MNRALIILLIFLFTAKLSNCQHPDSVCSNYVKDYVDSLKKQSISNIASLRVTNYDSDFAILWEDHGEIKFKCGAFLNLFDEIEAGTKIKLGRKSKVKLLQLFQLHDDPKIQVNPDSCVRSAHKSTIQLFVFTNGRDHALNSSTMCLAELKKIEYFQILYSLILKEIGVRDRKEFRALRK